MGTLGKYKNVEQRTDDDAYDDVMADGRTIGQARDELAAKSKARRKAKKEAQALANASYMKMIASEGAAEDDDIMDEEAGRMRIQLARESRERKAAEATALAESNAENNRKIKEAKAAYLTNAGAATGASRAGSPFAPDRLGYSTQPRSIPINQSKRSPSQQQRASYYPKYGGGSPTSVVDEPQLW